jgi:hypothetical protein
MTMAESVESVEAMLRDFAPYLLPLGGLEFYGSSTELRDIIHICQHLSSPQSAPNEDPRKFYIFAEQYHGKTTIAKATDNRAKGNGLASFYLDGVAGASQNELKNLRERRDAIVLLDGMPEVAAKRRILIERFNSLSGKGVLFAPPQFSVDANLDASIPRLRLSHIDHRLIDKLAWIVGEIRERLRGESGAGTEDLSPAITNLPARALLSLASVRLGSRVKDLPDLADKIADALRLQFKVGLEDRVAAEDLAVIFMGFFSPDSTTQEHAFRLWVEGETDCRMLRLVSRLAGEAHAVNFEDGFSILPLGEGREGGASKAAEVVIKERTKRNSDVFMLDFDESGKHAKDELQILDQDVILLDPKLSCSRSDADVEIEDFVSLSCLDRFYDASPALLPEREIIKFKAPMSRRIVVNGADKESLVQWLESNATLTDLENLFLVLCDIRARFSLKNPFPTGEMQVRRKKLEVEFDPAKNFGSSPRRWFEKIVH